MYIAKFMAYAILSLYNALCNTSYTNTDDIQIYTIEDVIYIKMKNDVSVLLDSFLYLWEQQSTFNPNMPIRGLLYFGKMYDKYITENHLNIYGKTLIKLPTPKYTVLYNGMDEQPAEAMHAAGAGFWQTFFYARVPQLMPICTSLSLNHFEIAVRSASTLGLVGAGGIGAPLIFAIQARNWDKVSIILIGVIVAVFLLDLLTGYIRKKLR